MSKNKLDCKVGEIWETEHIEHYKEIVYVNDNVIVGIEVNPKYKDNDAGFIYAYDCFGTPIINQAQFKLTRKKPKMKTINIKRFIPLWHHEAGEDTYSWMGETCKTKDDRFLNDKDFVKWIEINETFEVEDV
jgi:hypothetical protein